MIRVFYHKTHKTVKTIFLGRGKPANRQLSDGNTVVEPPKVSLVLQVLSVL